ncbi:MAG: carboxylesterase family protein [Firmicutes bacterium]|nr:carboxylesterase family protein [Bacillota bacterium]
MKRSITLLTAAVLSFALTASVFAGDTTVSMTVGSPIMTVNGEEVNIDENGTSPVIINERTLLPVRAVVETFGGVVDFEAEDKTVRLEYNGKVIKMQINGDYAEVNGTRKQLDVSPTIINGRTMLPIRFIADNFGFTTTWDAETKTATVSNGEISKDDTIVATNAGKIQGKNQNGVYSFLGVPYAQANEKFVNASPIESWDGVRQATEYSDMSPQFAILGIGENNAGEGTSNNCQNLNIWTTDTSGKKPVMVWLHGGGFSTGSANEAGYDGTKLSKTGDVVVVGVNHRLNVFGHLDLTAYGDKYTNSDNVGMTDIIEALQWVQENIDQFGGDPNNVTIFGESGGGAKVLAMMTSTDAKGLFHKAIVESGATENMGVSFLNKDLSLELGDLVVEKLGLTKETIDEIQNIDNAEIMNAAAEAQQELANKYEIPVSVGEGFSLEWEPVIDGDLLPTNPVLENGFAEAGKDIPLLIGSNLN